MCSPVFRLSSEPSSALRETLRYLVETGGDKLTADAIRHELTSRAPGLVREDGWPTALDDPIDDGLPWTD